MKELAVLAMALIALHWLSAGQDDIVRPDPSPLSTTTP